MLSIEEKTEIWNRVSKEFPSDPMMRDLHFIRELLFALKKKDRTQSFLELGDIARDEFIEWLKHL